VWPALGARGLLQGTEGGHAFDSLPAKPYAVDSHARDRGLDPGLCGVGGMPRGSQRCWRSGCAAHQLLEDVASRARAVAISGSLGGSVDPRPSALGRAPHLEANRRHGDPKTTPALLPEGLAATSEQLAAAAEEHFADGRDRLHRRRDLCLNSYTALSLANNSCTLTAHF